MRTLWILFSALLIGLGVALCVISPIDPLLWLGQTALSPALLEVPAGQPIARFADAALIAAIAGYFLIFLPLSAATWIDGGRQASAIRGALRSASPEAPIEPLPMDTASPWWPVLAPYAARADEAAGMAASPSGEPPAKGGRAAVIDGLVAHQSGAAVFGDFPIIALGLGVIALTGQILPVLATEPDSIVGGTRTALGAALARGFCSLVAATAVAALFGLLSRFVAAILRRRAESVVGSLELATRRWRDVTREELPAFTMTALPQPSLDRRGDVDDALVEHVAQRVWQMPGAGGRDVVESVDNAIRELHATTLRPMLHDISRLLSLLGERAAHLVTTVDDRLDQQTEHTRQLLAAMQQISQALAERGSAGNGGAVRNDLAIDELRQALRDERAAAVALLRHAGEEVAGQLDGVLKSASRSIARPLSVQAEAVRKIIERMDTAAAALARSGGVIEQSMSAMEQQLGRLAAAPQTLPGTVDIAALMQPLTVQAEAVRQVVERIDVAAAAMARTGSLIEHSTGAIEQKLDELTNLPELPRGEAASGMAAEDIAALVQPLTVQAEAVRQVVDRIDAAAAAMARTGSLIEHSTGAIEQRLDRLANAPEASRGDAASGMAAQDIAALMQPLSAQADAVRQVVDRIDAVAAAMAHTGSLIEHSTGAIDAKLERLATSQEALQNAGASGAAAEDIAALVQPLWAQTDAVRQVVERMDAAADAMARAGSKIEHSTGAIEQKLDHLARNQDTSQGAAASGVAAEDIAALVQPLAAQAAAVRKVVERIDAAAEAMARTGSLIEQSTGAIEQKLDRLASVQEEGQDAAGLGTAGEDIAAVARAAREALESLAAVSTQLKQATSPLAATRDRLLPGPDEPGPSLRSGSWSQRVGALHRASVDLTSDLPVLDDPGAEPPAGTEPAAKSEGAH